MGFMNSSYRSLFRRCIGVGLFGLLFSGCVTPHPKQQPPAVSETPTPTRAAHELLVMVPLTDTNAAGWLNVLETKPKLRLVLAVSPRFKHLAQNPALRNRLSALQKQGRVELALQLPNAPFLPLIMDTNAAKDALPS